MSLGKRVGELGGGGLGRGRAALGRAVDGRVWSGWVCVSGRDGECVSFGDKTYATPHAARAPISAYTRLRNRGLELVNRTPKIMDSDS